MREFIRIMPALLLCAVLDVGCSIKENRQDCPCLLSLDFSGVDASVVDSILIAAVSDGRIVLSDTVYSEEFFDGYEALIARSPKVCLTAVSGDEGFRRTAEGLFIPYGMECPPVYMYASVLDADCEYISDMVVLNKNFCGLTIEVVDEEHFPFMPFVEGGVDGYLSDGSPSVGEFRAAALEIDDGTYFVRVPRQVDGSLSLELADGSELLKTFALGEILIAGGYDWHAEDLEDVTVKIDYTRTVMTVSVQGWDKVYTFDFVI